MNKLSDQDIKFARMVVHLGYCTEQTAQKAGRIVLNFMESHPDSDAPSLARVMVQKHYILREQAEQVLKMLATGKRLPIRPLSKASRQNEDIERPAIPGYELAEVLRLEPNVVVFKARQLSMDRTVVIKILDQEIARDYSKVKQFLTEAKAAGRLNHPNVIRVHDVGNTGNRYYYSTEYVSGHNLSEWIRKLRPRRISPAGVCGIFSQVARALEYGIRNHVIHREIRPEHIYVGKNQVTKIAELGLISHEESRFLKDLNPHFVAPEQVEKKKATPATDMYCLGAVMYYALTNTPPFSGRTLHEILTRRLIHPPTPISDLVDDVPPALEQLVEVLMARNPAHRPERPDIVADELQLMEEGEFAESRWVIALHDKAYPKARRKRRSSPRNKSHRRK